MVKTRRAKREQEKKKKKTNDHDISHPRNVTKKGKKKKKGVLALQEQMKHNKVPKAPDRNGYGEGKRGENDDLLQK